MTRVERREERRELEHARELLPIASSLQNVRISSNRHDGDPSNTEMIGQSLSHYRLVEKIAVGGMGVVYRARDEQLERDDALRVLPAGMLENEDARRRFRTEALALAKINHPNIATVHEFDNQEEIDFQAAEGLKSLQPILADAKKFGYKELEFETRVAIAELQSNSGRRSEALEGASLLVQEAQAAGFLRIANKAGKLAQKP